jgi:hypothetical protein
MGMFAPTTAPAASDSCDRLTSTSEERVFKMVRSCPALGMPPNMEAGNHKVEATR